MKEYWLDANVLVRFLTRDNARQSGAVEALFEQAGRREVLLHLDSMIVAESVYVLMRYNRNRGEVAGVLLALIQNGGVQVTEEDVVMDALRRFGATNVDFAEAWLAARSARDGRPVASFDRDLDKFKDIQRFEPAG
jgi:predicted nucleic-acid-binding protein